MLSEGAAQFRLAGAGAKTPGAANRKWLDRATLPGCGARAGPSLAQDAAALAHEALNNLSVELPRPIERQLGDEVDTARMRVGRRAKRGAPRLDQKAVKEVLCIH